MIVQRTPAENASMQEYNKTESQMVHCQNFMQCKYLSIPALNHCRIACWFLE